jgi:hypothetical protein
LRTGLLLVVAGSRLGGNVTCKGGPPICVSAEPERTPVLTDSVSLFALAKGTGSLAERFVDALHRRAVRGQLWEEPGEDEGGEG